MPFPSSPQSSQLALPPEGRCRYVTLLIPLTRHNRRMQKHGPPPFLSKQSSAPLSDGNVKKYIPLPQSNSSFSLPLSAHSTYHAYSSRHTPLPPPGTNPFQTPRSDFLDKESCRRAYPSQYIKPSNLCTQYLQTYTHTYTYTTCTHTHTNTHTHTTSINQSINQKLVPFKPSNPPGPRPGTNLHGQGY
jgi:hypothetical protein